VSTVRSATAALEDILSPTESPTFCHAFWSTRTGSSASEGSEHFYNGKQYPLEAHFVHFNAKYGSVGGSVGRKDGLLVLGVQYEVGESDNANAGIEHVASVISGATTSKVATTAFAPADMMPPFDSSRYYYNGGLTTPTCNAVRLSSNYSTRTVRH
jgi:carbonic anhydrase